MKKTIFICGIVAIFVFIALMPATTAKETHDITIYKKGFFNAVTVAIQSNSLGMSFGSLEDAVTYMVENNYCFYIVVCLNPWFWKQHCRESSDILCS